MRFITERSPEIVELLKSMGLDPSDVHKITILIEPDAVVCANIEYLMNKEQVEMLTKLAWMDD